MKEYLKAFDKVIGYDDEKRKLIPVCDMMRNPEKYKKLGVSMPRGHKNTSIESLTEAYIKKEIWGFI